MKNKDQHKTVVDKYVESNMHIAQMISDSPLQMIKLNQIICGLGIMFVLNGRPTLDILKIILMISTLCIGYFISQYIERGIVTGASFVRQGNKKSGLALVIPMFAISVFLSDTFFYSVVSMTGTSSLIAEAVSIIIGVALPTLQVLQQIYKPNVESLVKELTSSTEMNTHMYVKKQENLIASVRLSSVERIIEDETSKQLIDNQVRQVLLKEIAKFGSIDHLEENIIDSTVEKVEDVEEVETVEVEEEKAVEVEVVNNITEFPTRVEEGKDIDEVLSMLSVDQLKVLIAPQHRMKRIELAKQCQISDVTVARKIKKLIDKLSVDKEA